jgi:nicotinate-nucleotide adenylyltransferase
MAPDGEAKLKIGVLGGTFDPVHRGHLAMAEEARRALGLDEVMLVPAGRPPYKSAGKIASAADRLEMLRLATAGRPYLKVSTMEIERPGPSYTVDTIAALKKQYGNKAGIYFILGGDSLSQFPTWREPDKIIAMCYLVAVPRPGCPRPDVKTLEKDVPGISKKLIFLEKPRLDISATVIRETASRGESIAKYIPGPVADYIRKNQLYAKR